MPRRRSPATRARQVARSRRRPGPSRRRRRGLHRARGRRTPRRSRATPRRSPHSRARCASRSLPGRGRRRSASAATPGAASASQARISGVERRDDRAREAPAGRRRRRGRAPARAARSPPRRAPSARRRGRRRSRPRRGPALNVGIPWPASSSAVSVAQLTGTFCTRARSASCRSTGTPSSEFRRSNSRPSQPGDLERREHRGEGVLRRVSPVAAVGQPQRPLSHRSGPGRSARNGRTGRASDRRPPGGRTRAGRNRR